MLILCLEMLSVRLLAFEWRRTSPRWLAPLRHNEIHVAWHLLQDASSWRVRSGQRYQHIHDTECVIIISRLTPRHIRPRTRNSLWQTLPHDFIVFSASPDREHNVSSASWDQPYTRRDGMYFVFTYAIFLTCLLKKQKTKILGNAIYYWNRGKLKNGENKYERTVEELSIYDY